MHSRIHSDDMIALGRADSLGFPIAIPLVEPAERTSWHDELNPHPSLRAKSSFRNLPIKTPASTIYTMPYVKVSSNAKSASVNVEAVLKAVSKSLCNVLDSPEQAMMVEVELDRNMLFAASTDLCAFVNIRSIGKIDAERNPKTVAALTETVSKELGVSSERVFINFNDITPGNWGARGNVVQPK